MADSPPASPSTRTDGGVPLPKPRWAFWKGLGTGAVIEIPLIALTVWTLGRLGYGNPDSELMHVVRLTAVFVGATAALTAGGVGRLAAYAFVDGGRRRAVYRAARAHAVAGAALVLIAAIPHGDLPGRDLGWLAFLGGGAVCGAVCGAVIGLVCSGQGSIVQLVDVWSLARRPRVALRNLLDPDDLVRLGSALRARTTNLFEGIFEPAPLPPKPGDAPAASASPAPASAAPPSATTASAPASPTAPASAATPSAGGPAPTRTDA